MGNTIFSVAGVLVCGVTLGFVYMNRFSLSYRICACLFVGWIAATFTRNFIQAIFQQGDMSQWAAALILGIGLVIIFEVKKK